MRRCRVGLMLRRLRRGKGMVCSCAVTSLLRVGPSGGLRCARHYTGPVSLSTGSNRTAPAAALSSTSHGQQEHGHRWRTDEGQPANFRRALTAIQFLAVRGRRCRGIPVRIDGPDCSATDSGSEGLAVYRPNGTLHVGVVSTARHRLVLRPTPAARHCRSVALVVMLRDYSVRLVRCPLQRSRARSGLPPGPQP